MVTTEGPKVKLYNDIKQIIYRCIWNNRNHFYNEEYRNNVRNTSDCNTLIFKKMCFNWRDLFLRNANRKNGLYHNGYYFNNTVVNARSGPYKKVKLPNNY